MKKIVVVGSINNDLVIGVDKVPVMGETVFGSGFCQIPGGKGANQAVACARLGADVSMIGAVGDDRVGPALIDILKNDNIDVCGIKVVPDTPTGTAMIIVCEGDNYIAVDRGANSFVDTSHIDKHDSYIKNADMVILQLEIPYETVAYVIDRCRFYGKQVLLNPAPAPDKSFDLDLLKHVSLLTPNESEAFALTGIKPSSPEEAIKAARHLIEKGVKQVVVTLGGSGCVYGGDDFKHMHAICVDEVVDTTAAGDSFTAALAVLIAEGGSLDDAVAFATEVGSITVTRKGAHPSLPFRHEIMKGK